jgi:hypothetical protein
MKKNPGYFWTGWIITAALWVSLIPAVRAGDATNTEAPEPFDYAKPALFTGTVYEAGSQRTNVLFTFRRTATRSNDTVRVERQFVRPGGFVAATEDVVYESGRLVSLQMKEFQAKVSGAIEVSPDPEDPAEQKIYISYGHGLEPARGESQELLPDTEVDDTIYPFMLAHWDGLMQGKPVKFHFVSLEWKKVFGFRLMKAGETVLNGRTVERIKMEPTNLLVAKLVEPLYFTIEKDAPHRVIGYVGRTTPRIKKGKSWKYLDADTVFDWKPGQ